LQRGRVPRIFGIGGPVDAIFCNGGERQAEQHPKVLASHKQWQGVPGNDQRRAEWDCEKSRDCWDGAHSLDDEEYHSPFGSEQQYVHSTWRHRNLSEAVRGKKTVQILYII
jgi:hypothetical protein